MKTLEHILIASTVATLAACASASPYYYDPYYGYYPVAYDDYYYDAAAVSGAYYYPTYYYYEYRTKAAASASVVPPSVRLLLERWNAAIDPGCITATTTSDNDQDGIDSSSTITFACDASNSARTSKVTGTVTIKDLDDSAADVGYSLEYSGFTVRVVTALGALTERVLNGSEAVQKSPSELLITRNVVVNATDTSADAVQRQSSLATRTTAKFTPEIVEGSSLITRGSLLLAGQGTFTGPDGVAVTLGRQTDPTLHWNNDCTKVADNKGPFDGGAIVYRSSRGRQTRIVHGSCTAAAVTNTIVPAQ